MKLGRKRVGKAKSYRISEKDYDAFSKFCEEKGMKKTQVIRALIIRFFTANMVREVNLMSLKELKENEKI